MRKTIPVVLTLFAACGNLKAQSTPRAPVNLNGQSGLLAPLAAAPQVSGTLEGPEGIGGPAPFGSGEEPLLHFAGENSPQNVFMFDLNDSTGYNTHVYGTNQSNYGDWLTNVGARLDFFTTRQHLDMSLDYAPSFFIYKRDSSADNWNQTLGFNAGLQLSRRFQLRVRNSGMEYSYGLFGTGQPLVPGVGPPGGAILYSINPNTRAVTDISRVDVLYNMSGRTTFDVFGAYNVLNYRGSYSDMQGATGGLSYSYRVTRRGAFSATYTYADSLFQGSPMTSSSESVQGGSRFNTHSFFLSYAYQVSKATSVSFFGGPERTHIDETLVLTLPLLNGVIQIFVPVRRFELDWSAGGTLTTTTHNTAISLTGSRIVSNGGGLLTDVNSDYASLGIARRLPRGWRFSSSVSYGLSQALIFGSLPSGSFNTETGLVSFSRALGEHLNLGFDYQHQRQREGAGGGFGVANLDRDFATVRFDWGVAKIPFGRHRT